VTILFVPVRNGVFIAVGVAPLQVMGSRSRVHLSCTYARGNWIGTTKIQRENYKKINKTMEISEVQGNACFTNKDLVTCLQKYSFPVVAQQMRDWD